MNLLTKKFTNFILNLLIVAVIIVASYFIMKTCFKWLLPFILAYIIAWLIEPVVRFLQKNLKFPRKLASIVTIVFATLVSGSVITFLIYRIIYEIRALAKHLPEFIEMLSQEIIQLFDKGVAFYIELPSEISIFVDSVLKNSAQNLIELMPSATEATKLAYNVAKSLPTILIFFIIFLVSTYFMSSDRKKILSFIKQQLPQKWLNNLIYIKNDLLTALGGYIKAQLILMSITFIQISIGLLILKIDYAILLGLIISLIDALPILGVGTILIPWAIISFIIGNYPMGFSLIILYSIALLVRQLLEPKVLGEQIGLYPLITLISMYVGLQIFGFIGMIIGPITALILINLHKADIFKLWK